MNHTGSKSTNRRHRQVKSSTAAGDKVTDLDLWNSMIQRSNRSRGGSFERTINSTSASLSSTMSSSGSAGRNFMSSMSLIFNIEYQFEQLQVMREKLLSNHGAVYATLMAEKLKKSFGLRALPSLSESQPIITFEGDSDDDISFTIVYFNSLETSPLNYILKHYFGSQFMNIMNEVYNLLYHNTLNTSTVGSEISEREGDRDIEDDFDDEEQEIEEEKDDSFLAANYENGDEGNNEEDEDDISTLQKESIDGVRSKESSANKTIHINSITERQATLATTAIVTNPQINDHPRNVTPSNSCSTSERSKYSIKYCDTNKLILNKKEGQSSLLNDLNSLPGRGLREHLLFRENNNNNKNNACTSSQGIYSPESSVLKEVPPLIKYSEELDVGKSPPVDLSPPSLMIDDKEDPEWSPSVAQSSRRKKVSSRSQSNDQLRSALMAFKTPTSNDPNSSKRYMCNFKTCGKTFSVRSHLDTHKVTHTGEKRYVCNECGGRFTQSSSLRNHRIAIHTKQFPHVCSLCSKGFLLPSQLKKHRITYHHSKKHANYHVNSNNQNSTSTHANALAAKILASAKSNAPVVQPVPTLWTSRTDN